MDSIEERQAWLVGKLRTGKSVREVSLEDEKSHPQDPRGPGRIARIAIEAGLDLMSTEPEYIRYPDAVAGAIWCEERRKREELLVKRSAPMEEETVTDDAKEV